MKKALVRDFFSFLFVSCLIFFDQALKLWTHENIAKLSWLHPHYPYGGVPVFRYFFGVSFSLNYVQNLGAAWGLFSQYPTLLLVARIVMVLALIVFLLFFLKEKKRWWPLAMIIAGAIGNIFDAFFYGHVVDMFHFVFWGYSYPVFNLADSYITIGILILLLQSGIAALRKKA